MSLCDWCLTHLTADDIGTVCTDCWETEKARQGLAAERYEEWWEGDHA